MNCKICNKDFSEAKDRNLHIARAHKIKLEIYCAQYEPRYDLFTNELIEFKNYEQYSHSFFNNRSNLIKYYKNLEKSIINERTSRILKERRIVRNLRLAPTTICCKLSVLPSPLLVNSYGGDYNKAALDAGLEIRFNYNEMLDFEEKTLDIIQDTREQRPLSLDCKIIRSALLFGDYTCKNSYNKIFIERKSMCDLAGTLSGGYERFQREIERSLEISANLIVLVEEDINGFLSIGFSPHTKHIRATPEFLGHRIKEILNKYPSVQFLFVDGRREAARVLQKIFRINNKISNIDLQYLYDKGIL